MARYSGTTEQRGLGTAHRADRERLLAALRDGEPCWRCGQPMYKSQPLDRDHIVDRALGGAQGPAVLAHRWCNRAAGARLGNQLRPRVIQAAAPGRNVICRTCGKPYSRAAKPCAICGAHYHPNGSEQRTCGRACGVELRRRKYGGRQTSKPPKPKPAPALPRQPAEPYAPRSAVAYYTCRYCGKLGATPSRGQRREVCPDRACQLARLAANNLITRKGMTREEADSAVRRSLPWVQRQLPEGQPEADKRWTRTVTAFRRASARAAREW